MRAVFVTLVCVGCGHITDPLIDPADPTIFSLHNVGSDTLYLRLDDNGSPFGAAISVNNLKTTLNCADRLCGDACAILACSSPASVRALAPGEAIFVEWDNLVFTEEVSTCGGSCLRSERVPKARYDLVTCFSRAVQASGGTMQRSASDTHVILNATTVDEACTAPFNFSVPTPDVHWGIDLQ